MCSALKRFFGAGSVWFVWLCFMWKKRPLMSAVVLVSLLSICMGCVLWKSGPDARHGGKTVSFIYKDGISKNLKVRKYKGRLHNPVTKIDIKEPEEENYKPFRQQGRGHSKHRQINISWKKKKKQQHTGANSQVYRRCMVEKWEFVGYCFKDTVMTG